MQPDDADDRDPARGHLLDGASSITGRIASVASAPHDRMRDNHSVMCGRIQTANQVHMRSWWIT